MINRYEDLDWGDPMKSAFKGTIQIVGLLSLVSARSAPLPIGLREKSTGTLTLRNAKVILEYGAMSIEAPATDEYGAWRLRTQPGPSIRLETYPGSGVFKPLEKGLVPSVF